MHTHTTSGVVHIEQPGSPEVLRYHRLELAQPAPLQVLIHQKAIGVNYVDVFFRNGTFPAHAYPAPVGLEAAGIIEEVGDGVQNFAIGDRVAYYGSPGAYAEKRWLPVTEIFKLPDDITFEQAASVMVKGLTAHMLVKDSHAVKAGQVVLVHAMAGGVGTLLSAWARWLGATVIGTVGSAAKKQLALQRGYKHVIDLQSEHFPESVEAITQGKGVDVVYDGTGQATFQQSLNLVKPGGSAVLYGWPSGMPDVDMQLVEQKKIRFVRAVLNNYPAYQEKTGKAVTELFNLLRSGVFDVNHPTVYALSDAATAHAHLELRKTTGSIVLKP